MAEIGTALIFGEPAKNQGRYTVKSTTKMCLKIPIKCESFDKLPQYVEPFGENAIPALYKQPALVVYYHKPKPQRRRPRMKKKEFLAGTALLAASSALCLKLMKKVGERLKKQQDKANGKSR